MGSVYDAHSGEADYLLRRCADDTEREIYPFEREDRDHARPTEKSEIFSDKPSPPVIIGGRRKQCQTGAQTRSRFAQVQRLARRSSIFCVAREYGRPYSTDGNKTDLIGSETDFSFHNVIPQPDYLLDPEDPRRLTDIPQSVDDKGGMPDWYAWRVNNWGTKWTVYEVSVGKPTPPCATGSTPLGHPRNP
jgi:hypothetical protein